MKKIEAINLCLNYNNRKILENVNITIFQGRITALIGPNGAGKSSTFRILAGLVKPEYGEVSLNNKKLSDFNELRYSCGYLLESPDFYPYLSGRKNLELLIRMTRSESKAAELLQLVGLESESEKKVQHYSRGMKQRLGIAQVMTDNPDFLILDEPFNGLDPEVKEQILDLLISLKNNGKGILVSTHQLEDIEKIADDFILMNKGRIYMTGTLAENDNDKQNVTLYFSKPLPENLETTQDMVVLKDRIKLMSTIVETEQLIEKLSVKGIFPYRVTRSGVMNDKYMEIINEKADTN